MTSRAACACTRQDGHTALSLAASLGAHTEVEALLALPGIDFSKVLSR